MLNELYTFAEPVQVVPFSSLKWGKFTLLHTYKSLYITIIPIFSHINSDVQSAKFNKNSDEKRKSARHNHTMNPSSILSGRHILHLPYDMHIVQRLKS